MADLLWVPHAAIEAIEENGQPQGRADAGERRHENDEWCAVLAWELGNDRCVEHAHVWHRARRCKSSLLLPALERPVQVLPRLDVTLQAAGFGGTHRDRADLRRAALHAHLEISFASLELRYQ